MDCTQFSGFFFKSLEFLVDPRTPEDDDRASLTSDIPLTMEDRMLFDYTPSTSDWPDEGRDQAIDRISTGRLPYSLIFLYFVYKNVCGKAPMS